MGYSLTAAVAFPALALFNLLRFPVMVFPSQISSLVQGHIALRRIQGFIEVFSLACCLPCRILPAPIL